MNTEQERADFQSWWAASDHYLSKLDFCLMPDGRYEDDVVDVAWEAYQAGRAALLAERDALAAEVQEQARLLGGGAERELRLMAERDALRKALKTIKEWPVTSPLNMDAHNMQVVAQAALSQGES